MLNFMDKVYYLIIKIKHMSISFKDMHSQLKNYGNDYKVVKKDIIHHLKIMNMERIEDFDVMKSKIGENYTKTTGIIKETFYKYFESLTSIIEVKDTIIFEKSPITEYEYVPTTFHINPEMKSIFDSHLDLNVKTVPKKDDVKIENLGKDENEIFKINENLPTIRKNDKLINNEKINKIEIDFNKKDHQQNNVFSDNLEH